MSNSGIVVFYILLEKQTVRKLYFKQQEILATNLKIFIVRTGWKFTSTTGLNW